MERIGAVAGYPRSERVGNGYRYYYNGGKFLMDLPQFGSICHKD